MAAKKPFKLNPAHKGAFTAKAKAHGEGVQQYAKQVTSPNSKASPLTKKQGEFARNIAGRKKK